MPRLSSQTFPKLRDHQHEEIYKKAITAFKYNHKVCKFYRILIEGPGISEVIETYETYEILKKCRQYFAHGFETKAYIMPNRAMIIDYSKPVAIEKTYEGVPIGKQL